MVLLRCGVVKSLFRGSVVKVPSKFVCVKALLLVIYASSVVSFLELVEKLWHFSGKVSPLIYLLKYAHVFRRAMYTSGCGN